MAGGTPKIFIGCATCGVSVGALEVAEAFEKELIKHNLQGEIIKLGCLGICFAEPLVYITKQGNPTICYKNLKPEDAFRIVYNYLIEDDPCFDLAIGTLEIKEGGIPYIPELERFEKEERIILRYAGLIDPEEIRDYIALGGYEALDKALSMGKEEIIGEVKRSGLRGLGGAGFSAGMKWEECLKAKEHPKYIVCNGDEGDPGAFMDRVVLESSPHQVIEGMAIAGYSLDAHQGYIYIRSEYPLAIQKVNHALMQAREHRLLGKDILGKGFDFDIKVYPGAGAFVCGESTALMYSIEGRRPMPRVRPPHSVEKGLFRKPTLLNNVKTFSCIPPILLKGAEWFSKIGTLHSKGTTVFALAGKIKESGLAEVRMGTTLKEVIYQIGGGIKEDKRLKAIQVGGPSGGCIPAQYIDTPVDFDSLKFLGSMMGSGGLIAMDDETCMVDMAKYFLTFMQSESCGKCTFCRIGTKHLLLLLEEITKGEGTLDHLRLLKELSEEIVEGSLCGLGQTAPNPILTTLRYFESEYIAHVVEKRCSALVCRDLISYLIVYDKCWRSCEHCVLKCPAEAIHPDEKNIKIIDQTKCVKCGICLEVCPREYNAVIKVSPKIGVAQD
ncbi:MAG: SLBB domain-containing protein [Syntrophaceae bacterium]|nr:SLBB domain-containing protein [Syntrophaceae bacterium]